MTKIAYLIMAHTDANNLGRLTKALEGNCDFFIHIDAKSEMDQFKLVVSSDNAHIIEDRIDISWAGISMINATLNLIKAALNSGNQYSHLILLSGADYPIKKQAQINQYFNSQPDKEFIRFIDMRESPQHYMKQIKTKWFKEPFFRSNYKSLIMLDKGIRRFANWLRLPNYWNENAIIPYFGSQWWALTPSCCNFMLKFVEENKEYYASNKFSFSPDEHFFHTLVGNSIYKEKSDGLQVFEGRGTSKLANFHLIHPSLSKWYDINDWDEVSISDKLFVRKVNSVNSKELLDKIDNELLD